MNKIYKVIWSKVRNCYVAVSEIAKRNGKSCTSVNCGAKANRGRAGVALSAAVGATLLAGVCSILMPVRVALAAPVMPTLDYKGGTVKAASPYVTINSTASGSATMNISSTQPNNVLKWIDFSIGKGGTVQFDTRNYLNYVTGHGRSEIDGTLKGTGNIYLINPNGILFGSNASVDVGNLYLSTRKLTLSELTNFTNSGTNPLDNPSSYVLGSEIINLGKLKATNIIVEGKNITFKNVADVTPTNTINVRARTDGGEVHVGYAASSVVNAVNTTEYTNGHITQPNLSKWIFKNAASETIEPTKYMLVRNAYELQNMQNNKSSETIGTWTYVDYVGNFMLANDIDFNGTTFSPGFKPIGYNDETNKIEYRFTGKFDGLNYKIKNLKITDGTDGTAVTLPADASDSIGLFGVNRGTIENLGVENTTINVSKNSVGGVVGTNNGVVRNVYHTGSVKGAGNVGGIVGKSDSYGSEGIKASYNTGNVTGTNNVGGIAGYQSTTAKIEVVFNEGSVNGETKVGGITGYAKNVFNSYNTGEVKGTDYVGGITGEFNNNYLQKSYNVGKVTGTTHAGGIAGSDGTAQIGSGSRITYCVFSKGPDNGIGTYVEDEANMKKRNTFSGFSMTTSGNTTGSIWRIYEGQTIPFLAAFLKNKDVVTATEYNGAEQSFVMPSDSHILGSVSISRTSAGRDTKNNVRYSSDQLGYDLFDTVLLIQPKQLTIGNVSKEYDGTTAATLAVDNLAGVVNGDATDLTVTTTSATYNTKNVGTGRTVTYNDIKLGGDKKNNYIIVDSATGTGSITAKPLTVGNVTKVYDGEATAPTLTVANLQGVVDGDAITFDSSKVSGSYANENVGNGKTVTYTVNSGALTGTDAGNYSIATAGTGDITPRTVTLDGTISKVYDATDEATPTVDALSNVIEADKEELRISATSATFSDVNVGDELTVTYAGLQLDGTKAGNYSLSDTGATVLNNSITQRPVTLTGTISKVYDGTKAAIPSAHTLENVIDEDLEDLDLLATSASFDYKDVGENNRTITYEGLTLSGEKAPNYSLTSTSATRNGNSIIPKELALVADKVRIKKGGTPPTTFTGNLTGFVPGEELNPADRSKLSFTASVLDTTTAGSYAITGKFNGLESGTYRINDSEPYNYTFKNAISNNTAFTIFTDMMPKLDLRGGDIKAASPYVTIDDTTANTMVISSTQDNNVLKWIDFSIDSGGTVKYDAKNYLNFVTGHGRSEIYGTLAGEGDIYLINPNGILFGSDAQVDVGSLYVSTRDISDKLSDFDTAVGALFPATYDNAAVGDIINMGRLDADLIKAEGRNISFKNIADVTKGGTLTDGVITGGTAHNEAADGSVTLTVNNVEADPENKGEIHLGFAVSNTPADRVNSTQYTNVTAPTLARWTANVTPTMYMLVRNEYELQNMNNNLTKENAVYMPGNYMLANDIDASLFKFMPVGSVNGGGPEDPGVFKGKFDGLYHVIKDITIDATSVRSDTFTDIGVIGSNAGTVENLGVVNGKIDATGIRDNNANAIGGIVGANKTNGVIRNVYFSGTVSGYEYVGGIAGYQNGAYTLNNINYPGGIIENAYSTGTVKANRLSDSHPIVGYRSGGGGIIREAYGKRSDGKYDVYYSNGTRTNNVAASDMINVQTFTDKGWADVSTDGTGSATWRIYEGQTMPLLTAFLRTKALVTETEYNGNNEHSFDKTLAEGDNHIIAVDTSDFTAKGTNAGVYQEETKKFYSDQQGYNIVDTELVIQPKRLIVGNISKVYDGSTTATVTKDKLIGLLEGDATGLTISNTTANFDNKNAGEGKSIEYSGLSISGDKSGNYMIAASGTSTTGKITAAPITLSVNDNFSKVYNGSDDASDAVNKIVSGELYTGDSIKSIKKTFDNKNVGTGKTITVSDAVIGDSADNDGNYAISYTTNSTGKITQAPIKLSVNDNFSKVYNGSDDASGATDKIVSGTLYSGDSIKSIKKTFDDKNVGTGKTITVSTAVIGDSKENNGNYDISYVNNTGAITQAPITLSVADGYSRAYNGGVDASGATTTITSGEVFTGDSILSIKKEYSDKNVGTGKTITVSNAIIGDGAGNNSNYNISYVTNTGAITQAPITLSVADGYIRTYDGTLDASGATTSVTSGEVFAGDSIISIKKEFTDQMVGYGKCIKVSDAVIGDGNGNNSNYAVSYADGSGQVTAADLKLTAENVTKTYDGTTDVATADGKLKIVSGQLFGDDKMSGGVFAFADKNVGTNKTVTVSGATISDGFSGSNYNVTYVDNTASTITQKTITATFADISKTYDGTTSATAGAGTLSGVETVDAGKVSVSASAAYDKRNAGSRIVNYSGVALSGDEAANYSIATTTTGAGTITPKALTATFSDITKVYDGTTSATAGAGTLSGVETIDSGKVSVSANAAYDQKNAGSRTVNYTGVSLSGTEAGNYSIATTATGAGTITPKALTATFADITKVYDGTTSATAGAGTLSGVETVDTGKVSVSASAAYDEKNAGRRTVNYTGVTLSGSEAANYSIATTATGAGTITPKELTATFADISKIYDGTTNTAPGAGTLTGVIATDEGKVNVSATDASYDEKNAGNRTVNYTGVALSGAEAGNYSIATTATGNGTIGRKALELVADPASTEYGDYNPASFTGRVDGFVAGESVSNGDSLQFALSDPSASAVGSYGITGTINGSSSGDYGLNYSFTNAASNANAFVIYARPASVQDMVLSDIIPGIKGMTGANISVTALDNSLEQATDKKAEVGIEFAVAQTILSVDAEKTMSLENQGMKQPPAMTPKEVAEQVHAQQGNGNGVAAQVNDNTGAPVAQVNGNAGVTGNEGATGITGNGVSTAAANENGAASNAGVAGAVNAAMDVVQQTDNAVGTEESKKKKGVA